MSAPEQHAVGRGGCGQRAGEQGPGLGEDELLRRVEVGAASTLAPSPWEPSCSF